MLNRAPIFINCFSRGGSSILWNLFLTHPGACSPLRETLQIFRIGFTKPTLSGYRAALLTRQLRYFDQWHLGERRHISSEAASFIDRRLHEEKLETVADEEMGFREEGRRYTLAEVEDCRLVCKNNNGLAFLSRHWVDMYPEAVQFGLIRSPFPLFEGHRRRGLATSAVEFADFYRRIVVRMLEDAERNPAYHVLRFEDLLREPWGMMEALHSLAGLPTGSIEKVRLKAKAHSLGDGSRHSRDFQQGRHYWLSPSELEDFLETDVNDHQVTRLEDQDVAVLDRELRDLVEPLGYSPSTRPTIPLVTPASRRSDGVGS